MTSTSSFLSTRASLLGRLKNWEDQDSWRDFAEIYRRLIRATAFRSGLTETEADEVVQETFLAVAQNIGQFQYTPEKCSFKSWLLMITKQRIIWQIRKRPPTRASSPGFPEDTPRTATLERIPDDAGSAWEARWDEEWRANLLAVAHERLKKIVSAKQYQIFDLYVVQGWPARDVARTLKVSLTQVYLAKHRVGHLLKTQIAELERVGERGLRKCR
jgi:RNA polymerase sigma-70 factor (ECF subfamily)